MVYVFLRTCNGMKSLRFIFDTSLRLQGLYDLFAQGIMTGTSLRGLDKLTRVVNLWGRRRICITAIILIITNTKPPMPTENQITNVLDDWSSGAKDSVVSTVISTSYSVSNMRCVFALKERPVVHCAAGALLTECVADTL